MSDIDERTAAERELLNGETAHRIVVFNSTPTGNATQTYSIMLDQGWCERIIASGMYDHDARGIAFALAAVLDCSTVEFPAEFNETSPLAHEHVAERHGGNTACMRCGEMPDHPIHRVADHEVSQ